jgi:hypothetical protein
MPDPEPQLDAKRPSKQAEMIAMLRRAEGATVDEVASATGWQRHPLRRLRSSAPLSAEPVLRFGLYPPRSKKPSCTPLRALGRHDRDFRFSGKQNYGSGEVRSRAHASSSVNSVVAPELPRHVAGWEPNSCLWDRLPGRRPAFA